MSKENENNEEILIEKANGIGVLLGLILGVLLTIAGCIVGGSLCGTNKVAAGVSLLVVSVILMVTFLIMFAGLKVVHPNEAAVYTLFGKYYGTIKKAGFYFINPFVSCYNPSVSGALDTVSGMFASGTDSEKAKAETQVKIDKKISTKTITLNNRKQKVNDSLGNPVIIGTAVIWRVVNPTKAVFNVDDYYKFLSTQCDAVIRNNTRLYPYDTMEEDPDEKTLRGSSQEIAQSMKSELQERVEEAGIEIAEVRITDLAYSDEIAAAMLQRQQATAVIAARQKIVEGAVGMVKMAIDQLGEDEVVVLDEERKAAMVSNLLVVLCGNKEAQPIVNSGSIY